MKAVLCRSGLAFHIKMGCPGDSGCAVTGALKGSINFDGHKPRMAFLQRHVGASVSAPVALPKQRRVQRRRRVVNMVAFCSLLASVYCRVCNVPSVMVCV